MATGRGSGRKLLFFFGIFVAFGLRHKQQICKHILLWFQYQFLKLIRVKDLVKSYADDLDRIEREYKQRLRKSEAAFTRHYNEVSSQLKSQQVPCRKFDIS